MPKVDHQIGKALSPYAITKYVNELFAQNFSELYGIETISSQYFIVFGPRLDPNGAYAAVLPKFVSAFIRHQPPHINGDGTYSRDFIYIENVIQANQFAAITPTDEIIKRKAIFEAELETRNPKPIALAEVFNIACNHRTSLNHLAQLLKEKRIR